MRRPHAVIIAGGRGERLGGVRKADLRLRRVRLVDRVAGALGAVEAPLLIASGGLQLGRLPARAIAVADLEGPVGGPLAGLAAAIDWLESAGVVDGLLVSAAVDTPFLPTDYVSALQAGLAGAPAAFAAWGAQHYPPNAIWRIEALAGLPGQVRRGEGPKSLKALQQQLGARPVVWPEADGSNPFANINTLDELIALGRLI